MRKLELKKINWSIFRRLTIWRSCIKTLHYVSNSMSFSLPSIDLLSCLKTLLNSKLASACLLECHIFFPLVCEFFSNWRHTCARCGNGLKWTSRCADWKLAAFPESNGASRKRSLFFRTAENFLTFSYCEFFMVFPQAGILVFGMPVRTNVSHQP